MSSPGDTRTPDSTKSIPTISRVVGDTIVELVFDPGERKTGLVVSRFGGLWNIERELETAAGETLVPYAASNNLIANACVLLASKPLESGTKRELLEDIRGFLHRYVDLSPTFEWIAAYYVVLTWVYDAFNELPYLRLRGDYGHGKTRGLMAIGALCYKPFFASGASTLSPLFHVQDLFGGTLILDEADFRFSDKTNELVKLLNNGTVRGMPVLRTIVNRRKEFDPYAFKVFGPKIVAMRGSFEDTALESRFITEEMGTRPLRSDIPVLLPGTLRPEALELRNRLLHFRLCNLFTTKPDASALIAGADPRVNQTAASLLSLIDDLDVRSQIQEFVIRKGEDLRAERSDVMETGVLAAALDAMRTANGQPVSVQDVAMRFNEVRGAEYGEELSNRMVGSVLRTRLHVSTRKSDGVYIIPISEQAKLAALASRFGLIVEDSVPR